METQVQFEYKTKQKPHKYILPANPNQKYKQFQPEMHQILKQTERCPFPKIRQLIILFKSNELLQKAKNSKSYASKVQGGLLVGSLLNNNMSNSTLKHYSQMGTLKNSNYEQKMDYIDVNQNMADILKQSYNTNPIKKEADENYIGLIEEAETSELKLQKLLSCTEKYNQLYDRIHQSLKGDYNDKMREIERSNQENETQVKAIQGQMKFSNKQSIDASNDNDTKYRKQKQLQTQINKKKLKLFEQNEKKYRQTNQNVLKIENDYYVYVAYSQQFQRALLIASASQAPQYQISRAHRTNRNSDDSFDNTNLMETDLTQLNARLKTFIKTATNSLFEHRQASKNSTQAIAQPLGSSSSLRQEYVQLPELLKKWQQFKLLISTLYSKLPTLSKRLTSDRENNRQIFDEVIQLYPAFLRSYIRAQQVYKISAKNTLYQELIREEKNKIEIHLKKNFGMIVPYTWTDQYMRVLSPLQNPDKKYLRELFNNELEPLQVGVNYINREYQKLYRQACEGDSNIRRTVENLLKKFQKYLGNEADKNSINDNNFLLHLMQSLRKLLRIAQ